MKNKIFILGAILGSFMLGSCSDFLKEESQSEVIPKTASDFSELLLGTGILMSRPRAFLSYL